MAVPNIDDRRYDVTPIAEKLHNGEYFVVWRRGEWDRPLLTLTRQRLQELREAIDAALVEPR